MSLTDLNKVSRLCSRSPTNTHRSLLLIAVAATVAGCTERSSSAEPGETERSKDDTAGPAGQEVTVEEGMSAHWSLSVQILAPPGDVGEPREILREARARRSFRVPVFNRDHFDESGPSPERARQAATVDFDLGSGLHVCMTVLAATKSDDKPVYVWFRNNWEIPGPPRGHAGDGTLDEPRALYMKPGAGDVRLGNRRLLWTDPPGYTYRVELQVEPVDDEAVDDEELELLELMPIDQAMACIDRFETKTLSGLEDFDES